MAPLYGQCIQTCHDTSNASNALADCQNRCEYVSLTLIKGRQLNFKFGFQGDAALCGEISKMALDIPSAATQKKGKHCLDTSPLDLPGQHNRPRHHQRSIPPATRASLLDTAHLLLTYQEITEYYKHQRMTYPSAHEFRTKEQEHCRLLLTRPKSTSFILRCISRFANSAWTRSPYTR